MERTRSALSKFGHQRAAIDKHHLLASIETRIRNIRHKGAFGFHIKADDLRKRLPKRIWNKYFKFSFVRNPYDWQVSLYFYMLQTKDHHQHQLIKSMTGFDEYIDWRIKEDMHLQKDILTDNSGKLLMDFVGKLESIEDDFNYVCKKLNIDAKLPHVNKSVHDNYASYYTDKTKRKISEAFREDFEFFGYSL